MTNAEYVLQELQKGRRITRRDIYNEIGYFKTPTAVSKLRAEGHNIKGTSVKFTNILGNKGSYHSYVLEETYESKDEDTLLQSDLFSSQ